MFRVSTVYSDTVSTGMYPSDNCYYLWDLTKPKQKTRNRLAYAMDATCLCTGSSILRVTCNIHKTKLVGRLQTSRMFINLTKRAPPVIAKHN
jgi:hypothetical protein